MHDHWVRSITSLNRCECSSAALRPYEEVCNVASFIGLKVLWLLSWFLTVSVSELVENLTMPLLLMVERPRVMVLREWCPGSPVHCQSRRDS